MEEIADDESLNALIPCDCKPGFEIPEDGRGLTGISVSHN